MRITIDIHPGSANETSDRAMSLLLALVPHLFSFFTRGASGAPEGYAGDRCDCTGGLNGDPHSKTCPEYKAPGTAH